MKEFLRKNDTSPETAEEIQELANKDYTVEFPIDLNLDSMIHISLPEIIWKNFNSVPSSMKMTYTGKSVILTTHWADKKRPFICGGPLLANYTFSQLHFIWGRKDFIGGKHTYNKKTFPLEIHALFYKCDYGKRTEALKHKDGAVILVFASKVEKIGDPALDKVCSYLSALSVGDSENKVQMDPPISIGDLVHEFTSDYFLYWGSMTASSCNHLLLWLVCRKPFLISQSQVHHFRRLMTAKQNHIMNNSQSTARIHPNFGRVFHINPSRNLSDVLYESVTPPKPLPRKDYNRFRGNHGLRPLTAGLRAVRSKLTSSVYRPQTAGKVEGSRKILENSKSSLNKALGGGDSQKIQENWKSSLGKALVRGESSRKTHENSKLNLGEPLMRKKLENSKSSLKILENSKSSLNKALGGGDSRKIQENWKSSLGKALVGGESSRKTQENSKSGVSMRERSRTDFNDENKDKLLGKSDGKIRKNQGEKLGRSRSVSSGKSCKIDNFPSFGICVNDYRDVDSNCVGPKLITSPTLSGWH